VGSNPIVPVQLFYCVAAWIRICLTEMGLNRTIRVVDEDDTSGFDA
jgi:hypothetical protein